jgi:FKBP-type peptidyl-prolyl cis-trans isomerase
MAYYKRGASYKQPKIQEALKKCPTFTKVILAKADDKKHALALEEFYIKEFETHTIGLNEYVGTKMGDTAKKKLKAFNNLDEVKLKKSIEMKERMKEGSELYSKVKQAAKSLTKIAKHKEQMKERMQNPEYKARALQALKDANPKRIEKLSKKVICNETGVIYSSFREACRQIPCDKGSLWRHFKGVYKQWKGKTYRYLEE